MRRLCLSENAVALIVADAGRRSAPDKQAEHIRQGWNIRQELAEASFSDPIDVDRLARARQASGEMQHAFITDWTDAQITLLRQMPSADRAIYARYISGLQSRVPAKTCSAARPAFPALRQ